MEQRLITRKQVKKNGVLYVIIIPIRVIKFIYKCTRINRIEEDLIRTKKENERLKNVIASKQKWSNYSNYNNFHTYTVDKLEKKTETTKTETVYFR